jgi:pimeloyl-ACP methyl ester carboxylesterase
MTSVVMAVTLHGSLKIPYVVQGQPAGTPALLLHGYADS